MSKSAKCHDCGAPEGKLHKAGCDMEECPFCGGQLISCACVYDRLNLRIKSPEYEATCFLPPEIYEHGLSGEQEAAWSAMLEAKGRIPYFVWPIICARCGALWPDLFRDDEWTTYISLRHQNDVLCWECYKYIKERTQAQRRESK